MRKKQKTFSEEAFKHRENLTVVSLSLIFFDASFFHMYGDTTKPMEKEQQISRNLLECCERVRVSNG